MNCVIPATTDAAKLAGAVFRRRNDAGMTVIFSTYHSIEVIHRAQKHHGLPAFDLIVCDEAHRTTGATFDDEDESTFVRVHNQDHLNATKRLYMTATPRVYGNSAKAKAETDNVVLCSMDDEALVRQGFTCHYLLHRRSTGAIGGLQGHRAGCGGSPCQPPPARTAQG
ncbi:MAG: DEAD/DEAH box helicase family protein [Ferrovum myxofaciens]